jgi:hypothetical protein
MSLFISKFTQNPLQDLQSDLSNPHENVRTLGKPKWSFSRMSFSLPFYTKTQSWLRNNAITQHNSKSNSTFTPHQPPLKTSVLGQTTWHAEVSLEEIAKLANPLESDLKTFDAKDFIKRTLTSVIDANAERPSYRDNEQWAAFTNIARTPIALEFFQEQGINTTRIDTLQTLSQLQQHFNTQSHQSRTLHHLIQEARNENNQNSIPHLALLDNIEKLTKQSIPNTPTEKAWATHAFRNGLLDQGENSDFMHIDARLRKLGKWIERKEHKPSRFHRLLPTLKKSPFRSLKFGTMGVDRNDIEKHRTDYLDTLSNALSALKTIELTLDGHATGLRKWQQSWQISSANKALKKLKELNNKLSPEKTEVTSDVKTKAYQTAQKTIHRLEKIKGFLPNNTEEKSATNTIQADLNHKIEALKNIIGAKKTTSYTPTSVENDPKPQFNKVLGHLRHVVDQIQGAARWKMLSGGVFGLGTKGISSTFTSLMFGLLARLKIDLRWCRTRLAGIEIAMPAYNLELMLYSSTQTGKQKGFGGTVGPSIGIAELTGGGNIKAWATEEKNNEGVVLRMHRTRGQEPRAEFKAMLNDLFECSTQHLAPGETLKRLLNKYPELSTNLLGQSREYKRLHTTSLEGNIGILAGPLKIGPTAEVGVEYQSHIHKDQVDQTGFLKLERHVQGKGLRGFAEARFDVRVNAMREPFRLTPLSLDTPSWSTDFLTAGRQLRQDIVYHNNRISPTSFYEIEYQSFEGFKVAILSNKDGWNEVLRKKHHALTDPVDHFLTEAEKNWGVTQTFAARWELKKETVDLVNRYQSAIVLLEHRTDLGEQRKQIDFKQRVKLLLNDPQSYQPTSLRTYERKDAAETVGLQLAVRLESVSQAEGVYTHNRLM